MRPTSLSVLAILLCTVAPLGAQAASPAKEAQGRNDCRLAAQVVTTGQPAPHREWAYTVIQGCEDAGPASIAALWTGSRRLVQEELPLLVRATRGMRDARIYAALRAFAETPSTDSDARLHALALLIVYANPVALIFDPSDLRSPPDAPTPLGSVVTHSTPVLGSEPVGDVREDLRAYYTGLRESDPDPVIRNAARILVKHIR